LKKVFDFYKKDNEYIHLYLEGIENADSEILKLKIRAIHNLKRRGIFKNFKILSDKKKRDILKVQQPSFDKLDVEIQDLSNHDILMQNREYIENEFLYRLDVSCVYLELKKTNIDLKRAVGLISKFDAGFFKPEKTQDGKIIIYISKRDGIYSNSFTKEFIHYAIGIKSKRLKILDILLSDTKAISGPHISSELGVDIANLSNEIKRINSLFKKNLILNKKLIIREKTNGYNLNYQQYHIIKNY